MRALLLLALLAPGLAAQDHQDADFEFGFDPPPGMRLLTEAERAAAEGLSAEQARNVPRREAGKTPVVHNYVWVDATTPYRRLVRLQLQDGRLPFTRPQAFADAAATEGLQVDRTEVLTEQGFRTEGRFSAADGSPMRRRILYLMDIAGGRFVLLSMQAAEPDWAIVQGQFEQLEESVDFRRQPLPAPGTPGAAPGVRPVLSAGSGNWASLPVLGSLVLALVLVLAMLFGSRG